MSMIPVVVFCYNRPDHLQKMLDTLSENDLSDTILYAFIDFDTEDMSNNLKNLLLSFNKDIIIYQHKEKQGLKQTITHGISNVFESHETIIVLEDDLLLHQNFIKYANEMLVKYKDTNIWHISGYSRGVWYEDKTETYFHKRPESWGWATWKDKWSHFSFDHDYFKQMESDEFLKRKFCNDGSWLDYGLLYWDYYQKNNINSWLIWWYLTIFKNNGLCINPKYNLIYQNGFDVGTHCAGDIPWQELKAGDVYIPTSFPIEVNPEAYFSRAKNDIKAYGGIRNPTINGITYPFFQPL